MKTNYFFGDNYESLKEDFRSGKKFVLFLGAGINASSIESIDLSWKHLLDSLFEQAISYLSVEKRMSEKTRQLFKAYFDGSISNAPAGSDERKFEKNLQSNFDFLMRASIIEDILGDNYIPYIQNFLYNNCDELIIKKSFEKCYKYGNNVETKEFYSLYCIARLIVLSSNISAIVTYNYDNFLSTAVKILSENVKYYFPDTKDGSPINSSRLLDISGVSAPDVVMEDRVIPVYHVHGYIPPHNKPFLNGSNRIVLSMSEFYESTNDVFSWQTATQLHLLSHYVCMFFGLSINDINQQRMIFSAHRQNKDRKIYYLIASSSSQGNSAVFNELDNLRCCFYRSYGLSPIYEKSYQELGNKICDLRVI